MKTAVLSLTKISLILAITLTLALTGLVSVSAQEEEQAAEAETTSEETQTEEAAEENSEGSSEETNSESSDDSAEENTEEQATESDDNFIFTAQSGDSFSLMARKATQIYGIENNINLSEEQIMYVETNVTIESGSPSISVDEVVNVSRGMVAGWVDGAQKLTEDQVAAWAPYAAVADFNTDNVGEARE